MNEQPQPHGSVPPRWAEAVLRILLKPIDRDIVAGDLLEEYQEAVVPARGVFRAQVWYYRQVLSFLRGDSLAHLRVAISPPNWVSWMIVAAIAEYVLVFLLPEGWRSGEGVVLLFAPALLIVIAAGGRRTAADARTACRTIGLCLLLFCVAAGFTVSAPLYTPAP